MLKKLSGIFVITLGSSGFQQFLDQQGLILLFFPPDSLEKWMDGQQAGNGCNFNAIINKPPKQCDAIVIFQLLGGYYFKDMLGTTLEFNWGLLYCWLVGWLDDAGSIITLNRLECFDLNNNLHLDYWILHILYIQDSMVC